MRAAGLTFLVLFVIPAWVGAAVISYWIADTDPPIVVEKMWAKPNVVKACQDFDLWIKRDAKRESGQRLEIFMTDAGMQSKPPLITDTTDLRGPVGPFEYSIALNVPCTFKPGIARVQRRPYYHRNPFHHYWWPIKGAWDVVELCVIGDGDSPAEVCKRDWSR